MDDLEGWIAAVRERLDLDGEPPDPALILAVAREVRRFVTRPATPVTIYLFGLAVGHGLPPAEAAARLGLLARNWPTIDWRD
ncbi:DUF6457 domain-containing protein [Amycolatopsis anabasis]|uniref:DUF6457 domain-containing protein n=1 Tax=Amycolatopsis anabasis TaxID=1840409 RepID=UPI00131E7D05|nr:DUF6457 domain-containing protein [Amycolatopsis anabasis]